MIRFMGGGGGGVTLDAITAAAANQAGILNADFNIVWKWAAVTDSTIKFRFTESVAATGGTSTSGVPNQVLFQLDTLAASTASPLKVLSRGSHVFSVSPSVAQILATNGALANPAYAFASEVGSGMYLVNTGAVRFASQGTLGLQVGPTQLKVPTGSGTVAGITDLTTTSGGLSWGVATNSVSILANSLEQVRVTPGIMAPPSNANTSLGTNAIGWKSIFLDYTDTATVGNVTINKPSGQVIMPAAGTQFTVTNSLVTAKSHIFLNPDSAPGNVVAVLFFAVAAAGSFTVNAVPAVTNQTTVDFVVMGAD